MMNRKLSVMALIALVTASAVFAADVSLSFGATVNAWSHKENSDGTTYDGPSTQSKTNFTADDCENFIKISASSEKAGFYTRLWYGKNSGTGYTTGLVNAYSNLSGDGGSGTPLCIFDLEGWVRPFDDLKVVVGNNLGYSPLQETISWNPIGNKLNGSTGFRLEYSPNFVPGLTIAAAQAFNDMGTDNTSYNANTGDQDYKALGQGGLSVKYTMDTLTFAATGTYNDFLANVGGSYANSWENWSAGGGVQWNGPFTAIAGASAEIVKSKLYCVQGGVFYTQSVGIFTIKLYDSPIYVSKYVVEDQFANIAKLDITAPLTDVISVDFRAKHAWNRNSGDANGYDTWGSAEQFVQGHQSLFLGVLFPCTFGSAQFIPGYYIDMTMNKDADVLKTWYIPISVKFTF
jgi:hypothetical protein